MSKFHRISNRSKSEKILSYTTRNLRTTTFVFILVFLFNLFLLTKYIPTTTRTKLLINNYNNDQYHQQEQQHGNCPNYGCPIYPAELKPNVHTYLKSYFIRNHRRQDWNFTFGTSTMAILTQQGASHTFNQDRAVVYQPFKVGRTNNSFIKSVLDHSVAFFLVIYFFSSLSSDFVKRHQNAS